MVTVHDTDLPRWMAELRCIIEEIKKNRSAAKAKIKLTGCETEEKESDSDDDGN